MSLEVAPLVLNLEGGYTPENVVRAIERTIDALGGADPEDFFNFMSIRPLSESTAAHNKQVCYTRRVSLEEKKGDEKKESAASAEGLATVSRDAQAAAVSIPAGPDVEAATQFKVDADAKKAALEAQLDELTGKINKKVRAIKLKEIS